MDLPSVRAKADEPRDKYKHVYIAIIVIGIGTVLPWNTFINANSVSASGRRDLTSLIILRAASETILLFFCVCVLFSSTSWSINSWISKKIMQHNPTTVPTGIASSPIWDSFP